MLILLRLEFHLLKKKKIKRIKITNFLNLSNIKDLMQLINYKGVPVLHLISDSIKGSILPQV